MLKDTFDQHWKEYLSQVTATLEEILVPRRDLPEGLVEVLRYSVLGGGKRVRPVLCLAATIAAGGEAKSALPPACALEMIHAYSLVHDDLPSMDNDLERRGKPTVHVAFGEATAVLAGDGLQAEAFHLLMDRRRWDKNISAETQLLIAREVADAAGNSGMVGGQYIDITARSQDLDREGLTQLHKLKTGALIRAAAVCGGLIAGASAAELYALDTYGSALGLLFQLTDDLIDFRDPEGTSEEEDAVNFSVILGEEAVAEEIQRLLSVAKKSAEVFAPKHEFLTYFAEMIAQRDH